MERPAAIDKLAVMLQESESRAAQVARLLHDEVGPTLSGIGFHLQALGVAKEDLAPIQEYLEQAMAAVRTASNRLQSNVVERTGLPMALQLLVEQAAANRPVFENLSTRRFAGPPANAMYQITVLALENACRHAKAKRIVVRLTGEGVEIHDDGVGFDPERVRTHPPGTGIIRMETYAGSVNLHLRIASQPGHGTIVKIRTI